MLETITSYGQAGGPSSSSPGEARLALNQVRRQGRHLGRLEKGFPEREDATGDDTLDVEYRYAAFSVDGLRLESVRSSPVPGPTRN